MIRTVLAFALVLLAAACSPTDQIRFVFAHHGTAVQNEAIAVAECESGLNPNARSAGGGNYGLFQINRVHRSDFEAFTGQSWAEGVYGLNNIRYAERLWSQSGGSWRAWTCQPR